MKRLVFFALLLFTVTYLSAQKNCFVIRNDAGVVTYNYSQIDSITHSYYQEGSICHSIWKDGNVEHIPVSSIESVCFDFPDNCMAEIPKRMLGDWDEGMFFGQNYVLCKYDSLFNQTVYYFNKQNNNVEDGFVATMDSNGIITSMGSIDFMNNVISTDKQVTLLWYDDDNKCDSYSFDINRQSNLRKKTKKHNEADNVIEKFLFVAKTILKIQRQIDSEENAYLITHIWELIPGLSCVKDIENGDWRGLFIDAGISVGDLFTAGALGITKLKYDANRSALYKTFNRFLYGNAEVSIENIQFSDNVYRISLIVKNVNTIPEDIPNLPNFNSNNNNWSPNAVECGVYVRIGNDYVTDGHHDYESEAKIIPGKLENCEDNYHMTFIVNVPKKDDVKIYFRPYMLSNNVRNLDPFVESDKGYYRYGETLPYNHFNGEIKAFTQYPSQYIKGEEDDGVINFNTSFHAQINSLDDTEEWGIYLEPDDDKLYPDLDVSKINNYYPSKDKCIKQEDWIDIDIQCKKEDLDILDYDELIAIKKIKLRLYRKLSTSSPVFDYYMAYNYSNPYSYELKYGQPQCITAEQERIECQSATVRCLYKDFALWEGKCGIQYRSDEEKKEMLITPPEGVGQPIYLSGLQPNTTYLYRAFIKVGEKYYWADDEKTFTTMPYNVLETNATNIHSTSATLVSTIENYSPTDNVTIVYLYSQDKDVMNSKNRKVINANYNNGKLTADISDLNDYTTYYYILAYKRVDGDYEATKFKSFKTLPMVTTIENPVTTYYSAELRGTCSEGITIAGFSVKKESDLEYEQYGASVDENGNISATKESLAANSKYYYYAFVKDDNGIYPGNVCEFTTKPVYVSVYTDDATNIKANSATLTGIVDNYDPTDDKIWLTFSYSTDNNVTNNANGLSVIATYDGEGCVLANISGLKDNTTYYYALMVKREDGSIDQGVVKTFKTNPIVTTIENPTATNNSVTLQGTCSKGITIAGFSIKKDGDTDYTQYGAVPDENGNFSATIYGLEAATTYSYYAFVNADDRRVVGKELTFTTKQPQIQLCPDANHPHWIDLGLPSGTLWRCCNEGATTPEAYGGYYRFGQVSSVPTAAQIRELINYTRSLWTQYNGVNGRKFTSSNGGTIFLPAAGSGDIVANNFYLTVGLYGSYWSSTPCDESRFYRLYIGYVEAYCIDGHPLEYQSVRPVRKK